MDAENQRIKGVVDELGLERDENQFRAFNLKIGMVVKSGKPLSFEQGERLMKRFRRELLGKEVEITAIVVPCPICGKGFNTEQGMKQHVRMVHDKRQKAKTKYKETKPKSTRKKASKKSVSKKTSRKK